MMTAAPAIFVWRTAAALWLVRRYRSLSCLKRSTCLIQHRMWSMHIIIDESRAPCLICVTKGGIGGRITCHWLLPGDREPRTIYWILGNQLCCVLRSHDFPSTGDSEGVEYRGTDNSWVSVRSGWDAEFELQPGRSRRRWCEFWLFRPRFYPFNSIITSPSPHQVRVVDVLPRCRSEIKGRTTKNTFFFGLKLLLVRVPPPLGLCFMLSHIK